MSAFYRICKQYGYTCLIALILILYFTRLTADSICGLFGIVWSDEGVYLLSAKNQALFGQPHLFLKDVWKPELIAPALHQLGLFTMTPQEPLLWLRVAIALHVVGGAALIAWLAAKYHGTRQAGLACFFWVLLNPLLFFYSHIGLSEGIQFFLMACVIFALYALHRETRLKQALLLGAITGIFIAVLVLAKISALPAAAALGIGLLASLRFSGIPHKWAPATAAAFAFLTIIAMYFLLIIGGQFPDWWHANIQMEVATRAPLDVVAALVNFFRNNFHAAFYLCLMPVYALYFTSLIFASDRNKGFLFILWIIAIAAMLAESFMGGEIRRNFFSLALLSILFGFSAPDFFRQGIRQCFDKKSIPFWVGAVFIALHAGGIVAGMVHMLEYKDFLLAMFCLIFLLLLCVVFFTAQPWLSGRAQRMIVVVIALGSLAPMTFQAFLTPRTGDAIAADIEARVPPNATIVGELAPWFMLRLKRRIIFTNCDMGPFAFVAANDIGVVAPYADFFIGDLTTEDCMPYGYSDKSRVSVYSIFAPMNQSRLWEQDHHIDYLGLIVLYEK